MPLARYGVLAGRVTDRKAEGGTDTPHYQIQVAAGGEQFRIAVNVLSKEHPSELLYLADEAFHHPIVQELLPCRRGSARSRARPVGWPWTSSGPTCSTRRCCAPYRQPRQGPTTT
jgi:uncharacterized protein YukJ